MSTEIGTTRISSNIECDNVIINSKGNLNDIIARTESTETKNTEQDKRISNLESVVSNLLNSIYPVGSIYLSLIKSPPSLGGTWELLDEGKFLYSTTSTSGETGGSSTHTHTTANHTLTIDEIPSHSHDLRGGFVGGNTDLSRWRCDANSPAGTWGDSGSTGGDQPHNHGNTGSSSNIPPYITCYMYKRTA